MDPVVVGLSDLNMPTGYDNDRLLLVEIRSYPKNVATYDSTAGSPERNYADICDLMMKLRAHPDIEFVTINTNRSMIGTSNRTISCPKTGNPAVDSLLKNSYEFYYFRGTDFFETFGIRSAEGAPSAGELSDMLVPMYRKAIVTRQFGELYWPGENPVGKRLCLGIDHNTGDTVFQTVVAVVENVRHLPTDRSYTQIFSTLDDAYLTQKTNPCLWLIARVRDGKDVNELKEEILPWARKEMRAGNYHLRSIKTYDEMLRITANSSGTLNQLQLSYILAGFFLVNLILGTIGTFWLQTRKRVPEMGIRRAFGAGRLRLVAMLMAENLVLTTSGSLLGCLVYLQYAIRNGLAFGAEINLEQNVVDNWISHFGEHFLVVSLIVYVLMILCVAVGTLIPALSVCRTQIVAAIRSKE